MKKIGFFVLVIGFVGLIASLGMDTTVASSRGYERIHNIGLMNEKQNFLLVSVAIAIAGVVTLVFGYRSEPSGQASNKVAANAGQATRTCPFCAEQIMAQAVVCRYCGRDIPPTLVSSGGSTHSIGNNNVPAETDTISSNLGRVEDSMTGLFARIGAIKGVTSIARDIVSLAVRLARHLDNIAILLLGVGLVAFIYFAVFVDYSGWGEDANRVHMYRLKDTASIFFAGLFILLRNRLAKPTASTNERNTADFAQRHNGRKSLRMFFGKQIDLVILQLTMVVSIWAMHGEYFPKSAYVVALLVVAIGYLLMTNGSRIFGFTTMLIGLAYLVYRHVWFFSLSYDVSHLQESVYGLSATSTYIWLLVASVAIPHIHLIRLSNMQYGNLRGDISFSVLGHRINFSLMSALVFCVIWFGLLNFLTHGYYSIRNIII